MIGKIYGSGSSCGKKFSSDLGTATLPENCVVDTSKSYYNFSSSKTVSNNKAAPGYSIDVYMMNINGYTIATNKIEGLILTSYVKVCGEPKCFRSGSHYKGKHTIYGKCTRTLEESYFYVPLIP